MMIYLSDFGYKLSKSKGNLVITYPNQTQAEYPIKEIEAVYLAGEGRISKAIMVELAKNNIDILLLSKSGNPLIYLVPAWKKPRIWNLWEKQLNVNKAKKILLAKRFVLNSVKAKTNVLTTLAKSRKRTNLEKAYKLLNYRNRIRGIERKIKGMKGDYEELRNKFRGLEGFSARLYFEALKLVIPDSIGFRGLRTRRPPKDLFNASISFGYGYLKYFVEREFLLNGLNPYYGYLHEESDHIKPFLTFDMMEGFRHRFVDKVVISLLSKRTLTMKHAKIEKNGVFLNRKGVKILLEALHRERIKKFKKSISDEVGDFIDFMVNVR